MGIKAYRCFNAGLRLGGGCLGNDEPGGGLQRADVFGGGAKRSRD
jgi:hypothetical protein